jgi:hypothetical protein
VLATIAASCTRELIASSVAGPDARGRRLLHVDLLAPEALASGMLVQVGACALLSCLPLPGGPALRQQMLPAPAGALLEPDLPLLLQPVGVAAAAAAAVA